MIVRILTAVIGLPVLILLVHLGGVPLAVGVGAVSLIGMYEFYKATCGSIGVMQIFGFLMELVLIVMSVTVVLGDYFVLMTLLALFLFFAAFVPILMTCLVINHNSCSVKDAGLTVFGFLYAGCLLWLIPVIKTELMGDMMVWFVFLFAFASDTGAYFVGVKFGRHKLAPVLSPKKSVEGSIGGLVASGIASAVFYCIYTHNYYIVAAAVFFAFGVVGSVFAQLGDLAASAVKREAGIKDYGSIFPGHGGVLDRFDSVLFTVPVVFAIQLILEYFDFLIPRIIV